MNTHVLFVFIFAVIVICTIILDVNASNDKFVLYNTDQSLFGIIFYSNVCEGKKEKYKTGWWPWKKTEYRAGKMK